MDFIFLRSAFTVVSFLVFLAILWWAWQGRQSIHFAEAARIPFEEDEDLSGSVPMRGHAGTVSESHKENRP